MQFVSTDEALRELGAQLIADTIASQQRKNLRASGRSAASLRNEVSRSGSIKRMQIIGLARWRFQQSGRGPGRSKYPSRKMVAAIAEWVKIRGLNIPAYAIAMKIQRDGIKVPNRFNPGGVLSEPLNTNRVTGLLKAKIRPILIQSARSILFS